MGGFGLGTSTETYDSFGSGGGASGPPLWPREGATVPPTSAAEASAAHKGRKSRHDAVYPEKAAYPESGGQQRPDSVSTDITIEGDDSLLILDDVSDWSVELE